MKIPSTENPTMEMGAGLAQSLMAPITGAPNLPTPDEDDPNGWQAAVGDAQTMVPGSGARPQGDDGSSLDLPEAILVAQATDPMVVLDAMSQGAPTEGQNEPLDDSYRKTITERLGADSLRWLDQQSGGQLSQDAAAQQQAESGGSWMDTAKSVARGTGAVASDVARGVTNVPGTYVGPALKAVEANTNFLIQSTGLLADWIQKQGYGLPGGVQVIDPKTGQVDLKLLLETDWSQFQADGGQMPKVTIPGAVNPNESKTTTGAIVGNIVQFLAGLYMTGRATGGVATGAGAGDMAKRVGQYAITDLTAFDAQQGNIANLIQAVPALQNPVTEYLATDANTPELEGRIKNAMAGMGLNVLTEGMIYGLRVVKATRRAQELGAAQGAAPMPGLPGSPSGSSAAPADMAVANRVNQILGDPNGPIVTPKPVTVANVESRLKPMDPGVPDAYAAQSLYKTATSGQYGDTRPPPLPRDAVKPGAWSAGYEAGTSQRPPPLPTPDVPMPVVGEQIVTDLDLIDLPKGSAGTVIGIDDARAKAGLGGDILYDVEFKAPDGSVQTRTLPAAAVRDMAKRARGYETPVPPVSENWNYAPAMERDGRLRITTPDQGMEIKAKPEIVELDDLKRATGNLQPRDRSRIEYVAEAKARAAKLDPDQLMPSRVSDTGAPIVLKDGTVLSGNGRVMSINEVYSNPALTAQAEAYKARLGDKAKGMKKPVLVMRADEVSDPVRFADLSNRTRIAAMSATERAERDAAALGIRDMALYKGGDFESPQNAPFLKVFADRVLTDQERIAFSSGGRLTREGVSRLESAVLSAAYDDAPLLARMVESTDETVKSLTGAMLDAAPAVAQLKADISAGIARADLDVTEEIVDAVKLLDDLAKRKMTLRRWTQQVDAFDTTPEGVKQIMRGFYKDDLSAQANRTVIAKFLTNYAEEARKHAYGGLIADETTPADVLNAARRQAFGQKPGEGAAVFSSEALGNGARNAADGGTVRPPGMPGSGGQPQGGAGAPGQGLVAGLPGSPSGSAAAPDGANVRGVVLSGGVDDANAKGIRAFHGSPHDFDEFSIGRIGDGEGSQAYGHGLYFADSEDVARSYRDQLSGDMASQFPDEASALAAAGPGGKAFKNVFGYAALDANGKTVSYNVPGRMYEVNIKANPEDFLDWDKPLSQQSEKARNALLQFGLDERYAGRTVQEALGAVGDGTSSKLREAGIPGIRYLDGNSRKAGKGSYNYVVFDDNIIETVAKDGVPVKAGQGLDLDAPNFGLSPPRYTLPDGDRLLTETATINTPERAALRAQIIDDTFKGKTPVKEGEKPIAVVMGGGGASGKSTVVGKLKANGDFPNNLVELNPDEFKEIIPEYRTIRDLGDARAAKVVHEESSQLTEAALQKAVSGRYNVLIDKTLGNPDKAAKLLKGLKDAGYEVRLIGVTVDPDQALSRASARSGETGRHVDPPDLLGAHKGFSNGFETYADIADSSELWDNVGKEPALLAKGRAGDALDVFDEVRYNQFAQKGALNEKANTFRELAGSPQGQGGVPGAYEGLSRVPATAAGPGSESLEGALGRSQAASGGLPEQRLIGPGGPTQPPGSPPGGPGGFGASGPGPRQPFSGEHYINWNRINTLDDVKAVIGQMADASADDIRNAQRGVIPNAETIKAAGDENAWKLLLGQRKGSIPLAHEQLALRNMWASSGQKLLQTAQLAASGGEAEAVAFRKMMALHNTVQQYVMGVRTETARALQQWAISAGPDDAMLKQMSSMLDQGGGLKTTKELAVHLASFANDPFRFEKMVQKSVWARSGAAVREAWINALLSNPPTHIVNAMSNTTVFFNSLAERAAAGQLGSVLDPVTGVRAGEATYQFLGAKAAMKDALSAFWRSLSTGESTYVKGMGLRSPLDQGFVPAISSEAFDVKGNFMAKGIDMLGTMVRFPGQAMQAGDEFFKIINARGDLWAQAFRQASEDIDRGVIQSSGFKARVADLIENPTQAMRMKAAEYAAYNTFTSEPGEVVRSLLAVRDKAGPVGTVVAPFVNTPANILKYTFDRTPLAPLSGRFQADMAAGGVRRDLAMARLGIGAMIMGTAYDLALDGHATGNGPGGENEGRERATLARAGWQRYSLRVMTGERPDGSPIYRYFAYNRMDPVGMYIGIAADLAEVSANMDLEDPDVMKTFQQVAVASVMAAADNFMEKTYTSGFASAMDAVMHPERYSDRWFMRLAGSIVPAGVAGVTRATDPYAKYTVDMLDQLKARTPGLSKDVPNKLNLWGDPISYQSGLGSLNDFISPIYSKSTENAEPIDREFMNLNYHPSDSVQIPLKGTADDRTVRLSMRNRPDVTNRFKTVMAKMPASTLVENNAEGMMERRGTYKAAMNTLSQMGERDMKTALNDLVSGKLDSLSLDYESADVDEKRQMIQGIMQAYRMAANVQVLREFPDLQGVRDQIPPRTMRTQDAPF